MSADFHYDGDHHAGSKPMHKYYSGLGQAVFILLVGVSLLGIAITHFEHFRSINIELGVQMIAGTFSQEYWRDTYASNHES